jgi:integrase
MMLNNGAAYSRRLVHVEEGIFRYREKGGLERFAVRFQTRGKEWRKFGFPTVTKARLWRESRKGRAAEGRLFPEQEQANERLRQTQSPQFAGYAENWMARCRARLKHSTLLRYAGILSRHLVPRFGVQAIMTIDRAQVRELVQQLTADGVAAKTTHNVVRVLSAIFTQAIEDGLVAQNPARIPSKLVRITKCQGPVPVFTEDEERLILNTAKAQLPQYYAFILVLFRTGLREGEAVALRSDDLNLRDRYLVVQRNFTAGRLADSPKSGRLRKVDLTRDLVDVLRDHRALQQAAASLDETPLPPWLFTSPQGGMVRSNNFRDRVWRRLLASLDLEYRTVHAIRHTFATRLIMAGANIVYVQRQLGHSTIQMTVDLYTHWIDRVDRRETLEVDRLLSPSRTDPALLSDTGAAALPKSPISLVPSASE